MTHRAEEDQPVAQSYRSHRSRACHAALVVAGWVVFALLWWRVLDRPGAAADVRQVAMLLGVAILVTALLTWAWIAHNVGLARRRGGRRNMVPLRKPTADLLGRRLDIDPDAATASYVIVRVDGSVKKFVTGDRARV